MDTFEEKVGVTVGIGVALLGFIAGFNLAGVGLGLLFGVFAGIVGFFVGAMAGFAITEFPSWFKETGIYVVGGIIFWAIVILLWNVR